MHNLTSLLDAEINSKDAEKNSKDCKTLICPENECPSDLQDARGDQCDNCGSLLNPTELIDPVCKLTGTRPVLRTTKHLFLDLPRLSDQLQQYIDTTSDQGGWSSNCLQASL